MRSVAGALTWSLLWRSPWLLLGAALAANALPILPLGALSSMGALNREEPALIFIHVVCTQVNLFVIAAAVFSLQGPVKALFTTPLSTTTIVLWRLLPAMALVFAELALTGWMLNALFGLDWPVIGPALLMAVAFAAVQATFWLSGETWRLPFAVGAVAALIGCWHKAHYGDVFSMPSRLWEVVTPLDMAVMLGIFALSLVGGGIGVARSRRGDHPSTLGLEEWLENLIASRSTAIRFSSPDGAQMWSQWRQKGWVLPMTVISGMVLGITGWGLSSRQPAELLAGFIAGGGLLSIVAVMAGLAFGNLGRNDSEFEIRQFEATRPLTTGRLARVTLWTLAGSTALAWSIWLAGLTVVYLIARVTGELPGTQPLAQAWWFVPASFLGAWGAAGLTTSLGLIGESKLVMRVIVAVFTVLIAGSLVVNFALSDTARAFLLNVTAVLSGLAFVLGTITAFVTARRRQLIERNDSWIALGVWLLLTTILVLVAVEHGLTVTAMLLGCGLTALVLAPIPAAPLALARNRTR